MFIYLVLENQSVQIGTQEKNTKEYNDFITRQLKKEDYNDGGSLWGSMTEEEVFEGEETYMAPVNITIPRVIRISKADPTEEFEDRLFNPQCWMKNYVWIERIEVSEDVDILTHEKSVFNLG